MAKGRSGTGIVLEFGAGPDDDDDPYPEDFDGGEGEGDYPEPEEPARPARDADALIHGIEQNLAELRALLAETG